MKPTPPHDGTLYAFIPDHLSQDESSLLYNFPHTVLFAKWKIEDGQRVMGSAPYQPAFRRVAKLDDGRYLLRYENEYGARGELMIYYDPEKGHWYGEKYIASVSAGSASGAEWRNFFIHFTALGLANGEPCEFDITQLGDKNNTEEN